MKTLKYFLLILTVALVSCQSKEVKNIEKVQFGIYETIKVSELPDSLLQQLKTLNIQFEANPNVPVIGYVLSDYKFDSVTGFLSEDIKVLKSVYTVDGAGNYYALVAMKKVPGISNQDLRKTKAMGKNVEIHFTVGGAKKWADLINDNLGRMMAFTIDHQVYAMPYINGEINNGSAMISGIKDEETAKRIAESINESLTE